jgi:hypothetical protein
MRWSASGAQAMLSLRCLKASNVWDAFQQQFLNPSLLRTGIPQVRSQSMQSSPPVDTIWARKKVDHPSWTLHLCPSNPATTILRSSLRIPRRRNQTTTRPLLRIKTTRPNPLVATALSPCMEKEALVPSYRAVDDQLERDVAIKVTLGSLLDPSMRQGFFNEARIVAWLDHPNIVPVLDVGQTENGRTPRLRNRMLECRRTDRQRQILGRQIRFLPDIVVGIGFASQGLKAGI